ncbi:MAG TPA: DNA-processing protein DprA [Rhizomicrobium sp.]|nr:DNA-processing protein DprA [Rhizomicrobium sp.]
MKGHPPSLSERIAWLRLARTQNVGPVTFAALIERFGSAAAALRELPRLARRGGACGDLRIPSQRDAEQELESIERIGARLIVSCEADFPTGLAALEPPPPVITMLGRADILSREMIAVVGARNASALGRKFASELAAGLGGAGLVVVSGLARGIDTAAHEGGLGTGTVAVLAGGVDDIYPPDNARLYERIAREGAIVSEMPVGQKPQAKHFPRRNRIISGLARGVVIVEAAEGSGSLITANFALEQGREVFAVPGSPLDPRAKGTNRLLRDGATLTESAEDVLDVLRPLIGGGFREPDGNSRRWTDDGHHGADEALRCRVKELLGPVPTSVDELVRQCSAPAGAVQSILLELELAGRLYRESGNRVALL